jgi:ATPase subunit of ABC transporter with duplicated ATPase domains
MISLQNLGMSYGERDLFTGVSLQLNESTRYGITGANGSGKSTLLKILANRDVPSDGKIDVQKGTRIAYLEQNLPLDSGETAIQIVIAGDEILSKALAERDNPNADPAHAGEVEEIIMSREGYRAEAEAARLLAGLGLPDEVHNIPANKLSGGQLMRALLGAFALRQGRSAAARRTHQPLRHAGHQVARKLYLQRVSGHAALDHARPWVSCRRCLSRFLDVDYKTITLFNMNYNRFVGARTLAAEQKEREAEAAKKKKSQSLPSLSTASKPKRRKRARRSHASNR